MRKETYLGIDVGDFSYSELETKVLEDIKNKRKSFIVAINPEKVLEAQKNERLTSLLNQATYQIPDGVGILLASRLKRGKIRERITGIDTFLRLCQMATIHEKTIFLYGAEPGIAKMAKKNLERMFPSIKIVGTMNGYERDERIVIDAINQAKPDLLFVALGSPAQEYWIVENMDKIDAKIFQGVGGSFDVISGQVKRAPKLFRKFGFEWLFRLLLEPSRIRRQLKLPMFLWKVIINNEPRVRTH